MTASAGEILEMTNTVMNGVNTALKLPGINMIPYVSTLSGIISTIDMAYKAGKNITPYVERVMKTFDASGAPSQEDIDALDADIKRLEASIDNRLPAQADPDEPE